jgi:hypothetical protein
MPPRSLTALALLLLPVAAPAVAPAPEYAVLPAPARFEKDASTAALLDFTVGESAAKATPALAAALLPETRFVKDGGVTGPVQLDAGGAFASGSWTLEMQCRLPAGKTPRDPLARWPAAAKRAPFRVEWRLHSFLAGSARFSLGAFAGRDAGDLAALSGGRWFLVSLGMDAPSLRAAALVRGMDGLPLAGNPRWLGEIQKGDKAAPEGAEEAAQGFVAASAGAADDAVPFGSPDLEIAKLRISKGWRAAALDAAPTLGRPGDTVLWPKQLDPPRAQVRKVVRNVGVAGERGSTPVTLEEGFLPLSASSAPLVVPLKGLAPGLYTLTLWGTVAAEGRGELPVVWRRTPVEFEARDAAGAVVEQGCRLAKQSLAPRRIQGFHLHAKAAGDYTASFKLRPGAGEALEIVAVTLTDELKDLPDVATKRSQNIAPGPNARLAKLTADRKARDDLIWATLPPANLQLQVHGAAKGWREPPEGQPKSEWEFKAWVGQRYPVHRPQTFFSTLEMVNAKTGAVFSNEQVLASAPWPGDPSDDGTGIAFSKAKFPSLPSDLVYAPRAVMLGRRCDLFLGILGAGDSGGASLPQKYFEAGDPETGHDAAMALVRLAWDWPAVDMSLHELRNSVTSADPEFHVDWSGSRRDGKYFYDGWSGANTLALLKAYDQVFPYVQDNPVFAEAVGRFIPWVKKPEDVVRFLDRWLVWGSVREFRRGNIRAAPVEDLAAQVLGPSPSTAPLYDLARQRTLIYPMEGTYQELYMAALSRSGCYHIGSLSYAYGDAGETVSKARMVRRARQLGVALPMDLGDLDRYPKVRGAMAFLFDVWLAGGFGFPVGDASYGTHGPRQAELRLKAVREPLDAAFELSADPRAAWALANLCASTNAAALKVAATVTNPVLRASSRLISDWVAIVEGGPERDDPLQKTAMAVRLGIGQGHAHHDYLDLNLFGLGLPMAVDLAQRNEGKNWTRPSAGSAFVHNHALAGDDPNPYKCGGQTGEPWLREFAPPLVRASYASADGKERLERDCFLMELDPPGTGYVLDVQRLTGRSTHTWAFHGCESSNLVLNTAMAPAESERWIDRTLEGTRFAGTAPAKLEAVWTMTRDPQEFKHSFDGGGTIKAVACEPYVLGKAFDPKLPPARTRATLLGFEGARVLQGNPYSESYAYCFPFLWVQTPAPKDGPTVFPAVYEWYRGDDTAVTNVALRSRAPLTVEVATRSGQTDRYVVTPEGFSVVSTDAAGLRYAQVGGAAALDAGPLKVKLAAAAHRARVAKLDVAKRSLETDADLPANPTALVGNDGRRTTIPLRGSGRSFTFEADLRDGFARADEVEVAGPDAIKFTQPPTLFHLDAGNRKLAGYTAVTEDGAWAFRDGKAVARPAGAALSPAAFADANKDGLAYLWLCDAGVGDEVGVPARFAARRGKGGVEVLTNTRATGELAGKPFTVEPSESWQPLGPKP